MSSPTKQETSVSVNTMIPVIDISGSDNESHIARALVDAAATHGFVYIKNIGKDIPVEVIESTFELSRKFFASPLDEKDAFKISENNRGWSGMHTETLDAKNQRVGDFKEAFNLGFEIGGSSSGKSQQPLPPSIVRYESELSNFFVQCHNLCRRLLTLFALGLEIPSSHGGRDFFASRHDPSGPSGCTLRLLHYPSIPDSADYNPTVDIRAGAHSDYGSVTLLFQRPGQHGLEILTSTGTWDPVAVIPPGTESDPSPPILVNIGDLLEYWTNGLLRSTIHRVIFPKNGKRGGDDRYSIAFFCHPVNTTLLESVPSAMVEKRAGEMTKRVKVLTAEDHLKERLKATYLALYDEKDET